MGEVEVTRFIDWDAVRGGGGATAVVANKGEKEAKNYLDDDGVEEEVEAPEFGFKGEWWEESKVREGAVRLAI